MTPPAAGRIPLDAGAGADGLGSLVVIGNALHEDEKTAEMRALSFTTCKLMEDVTAIDTALNIARGLRTTELEAS